jgi:hypothetical protein
LTIQQALAEKFLAVLQPACLTDGQYGAPLVSLSAFALRRAWLFSRAARRVRQE